MKLNMTLFTQDEKLLRIKQEIFIFILLQIKLSLTSTPPHLHL